MVKPCEKGKNTVSYFYGSGTLKVTAVCEKGKNTVSYFYRYGNDP